MKFSDYFDYHDPLVKLPKRHKWQLGDEWRHKEKSKMRLPKTLILALLATFAILAVAGINSAAAMELCSAEEEVCVEKNIYKEGTIIKAVKTEASFKSSSGTVTCTESSTEGETMAEAGAPLPTYFTEFAFSKCTLEKTSCTVAAVHLGYLALMERTAKEAGTLSIVDGGEGKPGVKIECGKTISCTLSAEEVVLDVGGGNPGSIKAKEEVLKKESGSACPAEVFWTATYSVQNPAPARLLAGTTKLCKMAPMGGMCPAMQGFTGAIESELTAGTAKFVSTGGPTGTVICEEAPLVGTNFAEGGQGRLTLMRFESAGACTSTLAESPAVSVTVENLPFTASAFIYRSPTRAILATAGTKVAILKFVLELGVPQTCRYRPSRNSWVAFAYIPMRVKSMWQWRPLGAQGAACPTLLTAEGESTIAQNGGANLWVTG